MAHVYPTNASTVVGWRLRATSSAAAAGAGDEDAGAAEADDDASAAENSHKQTEEWCLSESEKKDAADRKDGK